MPFKKQAGFIQVSLSTYINSTSAKIVYPNKVLKKSKSAKSAAGFTLIELLVVIAIIGLLASVIIVSVTKSRQKARDARRVQDINQIGKAMELYFNTYYSYPTTTGVAVNSYGVLIGSSVNCSSGALGCVNNLIPNMLVKTPIAPFPSDNGGATADCSRAYGGGIANDYQYGGTGAASLVPGYTLTFCISSSVGPINGGVHTMTQGGVQ